MSNCTPHFNDMIGARGGRGTQDVNTAAAKGKGQPPAAIDAPATGNVAKPGKGGKSVSLGKPGTSYTGPKN